MSRKTLDVKEATFVSIGGGLGSFAIVDRLRLGGVPRSEIKIISPSRHPHQNFLDTCTASGMTPGSRLRSDSSSRMDNIWGFPGYAVTEALTQRSIRPLLQTLGEPVLNDPYTPTLGHFTDTIDREAKRVGWSAMVALGRATRISVLADGRYRVLVRDRNRPPLAIDCTHLHLALGSTGPSLTAEAETYRSSTNPGHIVHAYEPHEQVYKELAANGGHVLVRGSGIAASWILQRLIESREQSGQPIRIWHLTRTQALPAATRRGRASDGFGFRYQPYSYPKAAFSGQMLDQTQALEETERIALLKKLGRTSIPHRTPWLQKLRRAREEGWYDQVTGEVQEFVPADGKISARIAMAKGPRLFLDVDHVIDATGRNSTALTHPLLTDLISEGLVNSNPLGCLRVDQNFIVQGRRGRGLIFASGMITRGAPLGPVDSFFGIQSAALNIADVLAGEGLGERLTPLSSLIQWLKWMEGKRL